MLVGRVLLLSLVIFLILVPDEAEAWWPPRRRRRCTPVNCAISWSSWCSCSSSCMGTQRRTGRITRHPSCGGSACGALAQTRSCNNVCQNGGWRTYFLIRVCRCLPGFSGRCCERGGTYRLWTRTYSRAHPARALWDGSCPAPNSISLAFCKHLFNNPGVTCEQREGM